MVFAGSRAIVAACAVLVVGLFAFSGCGGDDGAGAGIGDGDGDGDGSVTDPGTEFDVSAEDEFTIVLESNVTTGYSWGLRSELDQSIVQLVDDDYVAPSGAAVGAGGRQELTFRAVGDGTTTIELWYVRPFDDPPDPAESDSFPVTVGG